jgi:hypothetical protein
MSNNKKKYGQFYTTNYKYILSNMVIPASVKHIVEPFAGKKDLLSFIDNKEKYTIKMYDIDPKSNDIIKQDTLLHPVDLENKFAITNPPYLARNKSNDKSLFDKYKTNDLYKCYILQLIDAKKHIGGIIIIPLNFFSSIRKSDVNLRKKFLEKYNVILLNIFEEKVFNDTTYTVCSFQYEKKNDKIDTNVDINIYKDGKILKNIKMSFNAKNNYTIGGEIYKLKSSKIYTITRLTSDNKDKSNTNLLVKCIDDNLNNQINISYVGKDDIYIDETEKNSARTYASLIIEPKIEKKHQKKLAENFNKFLDKTREKYHSLFLTNYRESKDIARKRISFDLVYKIVGHLLDKMNINNE